MAGGHRHPSAEQIARALWTAAAQFDERHMLRCALGRVLHRAVNPPLQASWYVLAALDAAYPHLALPLLAKWVGLTYPADETPFTVALGRLRRRSDWNPVLERLLFAQVAP